MGPLTTAMSGSPMVKWEATRPTDGRSPTTPQKDAGIRRDPPRSVPVPSHACRRQCYCSKDLCGRSILSGAGLPKLHVEFVRFWRASGRKIGLHLVSSDIKGQPTKVKSYGDVHKQNQYRNFTGAFSGEIDKEPGPD